ncbi:heme-dependent oxidative N-demethylase family protein [Ancylobacter sp.]|uniref:heme-dependent oxidative N-demethylase family protein n=1 Tax=Ancylobacter sp. TaxID=1872567 RepID=UPI003D127329
MNIATPSPAPLAGLEEAPAEPFAHTPFDGSRKPFSIALAPLDLAQWIEPDARLAATLAEREALIRDKRDVVVREEAGTREAQREALELIVAFVTATYPLLYRLEGRTLTVVPTGRSFYLDATDEAPLVIAAQLISDDLLMLRKGEGGYRLIAAVLCFPSAWSLAEKFGQSLDAIHAAVPGYPDKMAKLMNRIFENLKVEQPVWRLNWSIYPDDELHHPESKARPRNWFDDPDNLAPEVFVRVERQTLRRLPVSGDMLFTVRVHVDPFTAFRRHPEGRELAGSLRAQILGLDAEQLAYKGLTEHRDAVAGVLERIASGA